MKQAIDIGDMVLLTFPYTSSHSILANEDSAEKAWQTKKPLIELAGDVIGGVAEAAVEIGVVASGSSSHDKKGCRRFVLWSLFGIVVIGVIAAIALQ